MEDIVAVSESSSYEIYRGLADGSFEFVQQVAANVGEIELGDFNNDGKLDIASLGFFGLDFQFGNGDGTFQSPQKIEIFQQLIPRHDTRFVAVTDINDDGIDDVILRNMSSLAVVIGVETGSLKVDKYVDFPQPNFSNGMDDQNVIFSTLLVDLNGDQSLDLVAGRLADAYAVVVTMGKVDGFFEAPTRWQLDLVPAPSTPVVDWQGKSLVTGDLNGDGHDDFVAGGLAIHRLAIVLAKPTGGFLSRHTSILNKEFREFESSMSTLMAVKTLSRQRRRAVAFRCFLEQRRAPLRYSIPSPSNPTSLTSQ